MKRMLAFLVLGCALVMCSGCFWGWNGMYGFKGEQGGGTVACPSCHQRSALRRQISGSALGLLQPIFKRGYRCTACGCEFTEAGWLGSRK